MPQNRNLIFGVVLLAAWCLSGDPAFTQQHTGPSLRDLECLVHPAHRRLLRATSNTLPLLADKPLTCTPAPTLRAAIPGQSVEDLPFFCRIEHQFNRKAPVQVKFRLGSVAYVDWLEGKNKGAEWRPY